MLPAEQIDQRRQAGAEHARGVGDHELRRQRRSAPQRAGPCRCSSVDDKLGGHEVVDMKRTPHVSETPATQFLREHGIAFTEHVYDYLDKGGTAESSRQLGVPEHEVIKTLVMQDERARPLIVLMHGDKQVSTKNLARQVGAKSVGPCTPEVAQRHSGFMVGGTSPFGLRKVMPVYVEETVLGLQRICINGGQRGYLVGIAPEVLVDLLGAKAVSCAL